MNKSHQIAAIGATLLALNSTVQAYDAGVSVYNSKCIICHGSGVAGAPKLGDTDAWAPRIASGMDTLVANAIKGKNAMPPKGACTECSESDIADAVKYMVSKSRK
jgi:cytochrome c5